ncbi:M81 family metallopeptidase [Ruania halotolerans]|uniref:M81 family metallopeptidase n=1 Tax=Ruania halotolerans TaxID=2897773 RepID=UPI001E422FA0|nr:M81 family metallopeptidase [Ruania halotolerans]UFU07279.1 M81 family metallopeptidase [Ruania halotolerans]
MTHKDALRGRETVMAERPRIAIVGMGIESSAYAQHRADYRDFPVLEGKAVLGRYPFLAPGQPLRDAAEWIGVFVTKAIPGGQVRAEVYTDFRARILAGLAGAVEDGPLDGVYLDIHGAMSVVGMDDAEGDLVSAVRQVVGPVPLIAAPMDLHGNISDRFFHTVDLPTCFRMAPHEDAWETRERSARDLLTWIERGTRPSRAWVPVPILLAGEQTSTRVEPARSLYARIPAVTSRTGVTDASIWIGYAWADEPRCHASVVVTGEDESVIAGAAEELAEALWQVREEFDFVGPPGTLDEGIDAALAHRATGGGQPYLVSDSGDNPGAGGSGDVTWTLARVLQRTDLVGPGAPRTYIASVFDAVAIETLCATAVGEPVDVMIGARVDDRVSGPVRVQGVLHSLHEADPAAGRIAVIAVGGVHVIVTEFRKAFHGTEDFARLGLEPSEADLIVTKIGYLEPTLYDIAQGWTLALTPGPVDQNLQRLGHERIRRPMFPFDDFPEQPELRATVLPGGSLPPEMSA